MIALTKHVIKNNGYNEWTIDQFGQAVCPCGNSIEIDGKCPNGHISPVRQEGMI